MVAGNGGRARHSLTRVWIGAGPLPCRREMLPGTCQGSTPFWVLGKGDSGSRLHSSAPGP